MAIRLDALEDDELGGDDLGGAGEEGLGESWEALGGRGGYGSGLAKQCEAILRGINQ